MTKALVEATDGLMEPILRSSHQRLYIARTLVEAEPVRMNQSRGWHQSAI